MDDQAQDAEQPWWVYRGLSDEALRDERDLSDAVRPTKGYEGSSAALRDAVRTSLHPDNAPPWRRFDEQEKERDRGAEFLVDADVKSRVNAALLLRRPLLLTGPPGTGKTSLAYAVARELGLGPVLRWSITSRTELRDGLYRYDAIARLQDAQRYYSDGPVGAHSRAPAKRWGAWSGRAGARRRRPPSIQDYLKLGPLGSAFAGFADPARIGYPRVLLIDEIDKSDIDLPNDLLHIFEEGYFEIDELRRDGADEHYIETEDRSTVRIVNGRVRCGAFPFVVMTSNSEREFPPPFLRRCIQLAMHRPDQERLTQIVRRKLRGSDPVAYDRNQEAIEAQIIPAFAGLVDSGERDLAVDQLLQVVLLRMKDVDPFEGVNPLNAREHRPLISALWKSLREGQD